MLCKYYVAPEEKSMARFLFQEAGIKASLLAENEICRSDVTIVLLSFGSTKDFREIIERHNYNQIIVLNGYVTYDLARTVVWYDRPQQVIETLKKLNVKRKKEKVMPLTSNSKQQHQKRKRMQKVKCPFCDGDIGAVTLGLANHLKACREYRKRPEVHGRMHIYRQPNGKSRGSVLVVNLPRELIINDRHLRAGIHMITDPKLIKLLNPVLRDTFRYTLTKHDEADQ